MIKKSISLAATVSASFMAVGAVLAGGLAPEPAMAHPKHKSKSAARHYSAATSPQSAIERRLRALEDELNAVRAELNRTRAEAKTQTAPAAIQRVEAKQQQLEQQLIEAKEHEESHHDLLFFRGGYTKMEHARNNELLLNNRYIGSTSDEKDGEGWYVGAGFDHRLTDDLWGLTDAAALDGEVMFEYKNFGTSHNALVDSAGTTLASLSGLGGTPGLGGGTTVIKNQLTQFTLTASPKIKFNNMGDFRPWIIPFGLAIHVISPPSSGVTVLNPGLMLGTGAEYQIWKTLYAGLDFRYHFTGDDFKYKTNVPGLGTVLNKTDIDGFTTGAYLGFGF